MPLYHLIWGWATTSHGDIQFLEGMNSRIKLSTSRWQRISMSLLSARLGVQFQITSNSGEGKLSAARDMMVNMNSGKSFITEQGGSSLVQWAGGERWEPPLATAGLPNKNEIQRSEACSHPLLCVSKPKLWAMKQTLLLNRHFKKPTAAHVISIGPLAKDGIACVCCDTHHSTAYGGVLCC